MFQLKLKVKVTITLKLQYHNPCYIATIDYDFRQKVFLLWPKHLLFSQSQLHFCWYLVKMLHRLVTIAVWLLNQISFAALIAATYPLMSPKRKKKLSGSAIVETGHIKFYIINFYLFKNYLNTYLVKMSNNIRS